MSKIKKFLISNLSFLILFLLLFLPVFMLYADGETLPSDSSAGKIVNPIPTITSIPGLIHTILDGLLTVGIPLLALAIVYCGFLFVSARGNPEKITKARDALLYTLIGAAILLGSWALAKMIAATVDLL